MTNRVKFIYAGLSLTAITAGLFWASQPKHPVAEILPSAPTAAQDHGAASPEMGPHATSPSSQQASIPAQLPSTNAAEAKPQAVVEAPASPVQPPKNETQASGCFEMTFHHRKLPTHADAESCHRHKNRIKLAHAIHELHGLCVRVDGDAVAFEKIKGSENEILLAGVAGPDSLIQVNYCKGAVKCSAECKIKPRKDAFLEAVGGAADEKESGEIAEWDSEGANDADRKAVREVASEIQALDEDLKSEKDEDSVEFTGWESGAEKASSCELRKQTQRESPRG